jgi:hypothetical protein
MTGPDGPLKHLTKTVLESTMFVTFGSTPRAGSREAEVCVSAALFGFLTCRKAVDDDAM